MTGPFPGSMPLADLTALREGAGQPEWPVLPGGWTQTGDTEMITWAATAGPARGNPCRVYWGSHGCDLERGHGKRLRPHDCGCCDCGDSHPQDDGALCVARKPWYGWQTRFYGEDLSSWERARSRLLTALFRVREMRRRRRIRQGLSR